MSAVRILVLCTGNSARSQIAEALLQTRGAGRVEAVSAGSEPSERVNAYAVDVLREHGITWEGHVPQGLEDVWTQHFDLVITVCDNARDACPFFPGANAQVHWGMRDPVHEPTPERSRAAFAETYAVLAAHVDALLALPLASMSAVDLEREAQAIHDVSAS